MVCCAEVDNMNRQYRYRLVQYVGRYSHVLISFSLSFFLLWTFKFKFKSSQIGLVVKFCLTLMTPWTVAHQAPLSMAFPRQEYWNGVPSPSPGDLPEPGIEPASPALAGGLFTTEPPGLPMSQRSQGSAKLLQSFLTLRPLGL